MFRRVISESVAAEHCCMVYVLLFNQTDQRDETESLEMERLPGIGGKMKTEETVFFVFCVT